jgi:hypothetical protein
MTRKTPSDFASHDDWLSYVRSEIAISDQPYALAFGRIDLFRSFYRMQGLPFPAQFAEELERIETLHDPKRAAALGALNDTILGSLTKQLFNRVPPTPSEDDSRRPSPQEQIQKLLDHLAQQNPYFRLWVVYKRCVSDYSVAASWDEYLFQELGTESDEEIAFAHAMVELGSLLTLFYDGNLALPSLTFERIWFLHSLRGAERMLQTRAVLGILTAELAACTSA